MEEITLKAEKAFLAVPIYLYDDSEPKEEKIRQADLRFLLIYDVDGKEIYRFVTPWKQDMEAEPDYYSCIPIREWLGQKITIRTEQPHSFLERIRQTDSFLYKREGLSDPASPDFSEAGQLSESERPALHYTAPLGWINDPNGMVYQDGMWHLYYQHNPMNIEWANMSWGHAVSEDLIHFRYQGDVLFPDTNGAMFSGCGLVNERGCFGIPKDALLFFYTASMDPTRLAEGITNTQRMAYSLDHGKTLIKYPDWNLPNYGGDNRDPKIFWHEESRSYICVLFLKDHSFAILRSRDLEHWEMSQTMEYDPMWECPDLLRLHSEEGEEKWAFLSADGFYYIGSFDGYSFTKESPMQQLYQSPEDVSGSSMKPLLPYAGQTFSNAGNRVIQIAWLRIPNRGTHYTGAMSIPREFSLGKDEKGYFIFQKFAVESARYQIHEEDGSTVIEDSYIKEQISPEGRFCCVSLR